MPSERYEGEKRNVPIQVKFTGTEYNKLHSAARKAKVTVAQLLRSLADDYLAKYNDRHTLNVKGVPMTFNTEEFEALEQQVRVMGLKVRELERRQML